MPNFRSLIGGFFSSTPMDKTSGPVTIRCNNPGAINGAKWEKTFPGYVDTVLTTPGNKSTIFEAPEYGAGAWWELLRQYRAKNFKTISDIIQEYGGGQDYSVYLQFVLRQTGFTQDTVIDLKDDQQLLKFGRAMFRFEAGRELPWSDKQLLFGFTGARAFASTGAWPASTAPGTQPVPGTQPTPGPQPPGGQTSGDDLMAVLQKLLMALAANPSAPTANPSANTGPSTPSGNPPTPPAISVIDQLLGGQALVGSKTLLGVISYVLVAILKATGVLSAATPAGQILTVLSIALAVLGGVAKVDRASQAVVNLAASAKSDSK